VSEGAGVPSVIFISLLPVFRDAVEAEMIIIIIRQRISLNGLIFIVSPGVFLPYRNLSLLKDIAQSGNDFSRYK